MDSVGHKYSEIESQKLYIHTYSLVFIDLHIMHTVIFSANNNWDCISKVSWTPQVEAKIMNLELD